MPVFETKRLAEHRDAVAPDGSDVRILHRLSSGSMAHFALAAGETSTAVAHRSVDEIWFVVSGRGELWRKHQGYEEVVALAAGTSVTIPCGASFQFRAFEPLAIAAVTIPPWPNGDEAYTVEGKWSPTVPR